MPLLIAFHDEQMCMLKFFVEHIRVMTSVPAIDSRVPQRPQPSCAGPTERYLPTAIDVCGRSGHEIRLRITAPKAFTATSKEISTPQCSGIGIDCAHRNPWGIQLMDTKRR